MRPDFDRLPGPLRQQAPAATSRRIASASASWYRCSCVRSSSFPAGADSASSTLATTAAHSGVRSPCHHPCACRTWSPAARPGRRTPGPGPHRAGRPRARSYISREQPGQVRQPQPSGRGRDQQLVGRRPGTSPAACPVHWQIVRPYGLRQLARRPAPRITRGCVSQPAWPTRCGRPRRRG